MSMKYEEWYVKGIFEQVNYLYGDLALLIMKDCTENGLQCDNPHFVDEFCRRIGLDEYRHYDQVIRHIRDNEVLHDFWIL